MDTSIKGEGEASVGERGEGGESVGGGGGWKGMGSSDGGLEGDGFKRWGVGRGWVQAMGVVGSQRLNERVQAYRWMSVDNGSVEEGLMG